MDEEKKHSRALELGERILCLDFANTLQWHASENPQENLRTYHDLVKWSRNEGLLSEDEAQKLIRQADQDSIDAEKALKKARELREAIYRIFSSVAAGSVPENKDLNIINKNLSKAMTRSRIVIKGKDFAWDFGEDKDVLDWMLDSVVRSSADLLVSDQLNRVKECADDRGCGWLFVDRSRNRSRKWCDMKDCGNRAKAKRFYERRQKNKIE
jgi:predicted RNA-binding Zn ribbon-like protein